MYKTYIDVVHISKDATTKSFTTAASTAEGAAEAEAKVEAAANPLTRAGELNDVQLAAKEAAFKVGYCDQFPIPCGLRIHSI